MSRDSRDILVEDLDKRIAELEVENTRLLGVERRWKAMVENGWYLLKGETDWAVFEGDNDSVFYAIGPTPKAAVDAAIEKLEGKT